MSNLTPEQQAAVRTQVADDADPELRMKAIRLVRALTPKGVQTHTASAQTATTTAPAASAQAVATPANTAPPAAAPGAAAVSQPNHRAAYEQLKSTNPFEAAHLGLTHAASVYGDK